MKESQLIHCKQLLPFSKEFLQNPQDKILHPMYRKMRNFLDASAVFQHAKHCVIALSGGLDSVVLTHMLACYRVRGHSTLSFSTAHVHHGVRGAQADRDASFAKEIARLHGMPCTVLHAPSQQDHQRVSAEAHLRSQRLQALEAHAQGFGAQTCIATAHHQDDQVETMVHRFFQGSDLMGLQGIQAEVAPLWLRPLLDLSKEQLRQLAEHRQLPYMHDDTNNQTHIMRNKIRHHLLPWLETQVNPSVRTHILGLQQSIQEHTRMVRFEATQRLEQANIQGSSYQVHVFKEAAPPVQKQMIQMAYQAIAGKNHALSREQLRVITSWLYSGQAMKKYALAGGVGVEMQDDVLIFTKQEENL
jgi:tRNA(Ile)-lysidine synthase